MEALECKTNLSIKKWIWQQVSIKSLNTLRRSMLFIQGFPWQPPEHHEVLDCANMIRWSFWVDQEIKEGRNLV